MIKKFIRIILLLMAQAMMCVGDDPYAQTIFSPEMTVKAYFDAYIAQDWEACTEYIHPEMLERLHGRIIDMVEEVSWFTRNLLLGEYHVRSVDELKAMPPRQLYIMYLQNRWNGLDSETSQMLATTQLFVIKTKRVNDHECQVEFKTTVTEDNQTYNKVEAYRLKRFDGQWKIFDTEGLKKLDNQKPTAQKQL